MTPSQEPAGQNVPEQRIDSTFRNGSVTAIGIVLGFSLGFLNQWASNPIAWSLVDVAAAMPIIAGIGLQGKAFADMLSTQSLILNTYNRAIKTFLIGLSLVAAGVAIAMLLDILGLGPRSLSR